MNAPRHPLLQASALFLALLAVTLELLQPLGHAALMRNGPPGALWSVFCSAATADPDRTETDGGSKSMPAPSSRGHECCLGLAHAPLLVPPSDAFVLVPPIETASAVALPATERPSIAIRDGPHRPRGPPPSPTT
jgi:hypothetical protein